MESLKQTLRDAGINFDDNSYPDELRIRPQQDKSKYARPLLGNGQTGPRFPLNPLGMKPVDVSVTPKTYPTQPLRSGNGVTDQFGGIWVLRFLFIDQNVYKM